MSVRITQRMMTQHSLASLQLGLSRVAGSQDRLSSGKSITKPSDSPTGTNDAMRLRAAIAAGDQQVRNAQDGMSWLDDADSTLSSMFDSISRARDLIVQGSSTGSGTPDAREALAQELGQIRDGLLDSANSQHLGRPLFGGTTSGGAAYAQAADGTVSFVGDTNEVTRTIGDGVHIAVNVTGPATFGANGTDVFAVLGTAIDQLRTDPGSLSTSLTALDAVTGSMRTAQTDIGARYNRIETATTALSSRSLDNQASLSSVEDVDLAQAILDVQTQQTAYQVALGATAKVIQPSLLDFLR